MARLGRGGHGSNMVSQNEGYVERDNIMSGSETHNFLYRKRWSFLQRGSSSCKSLKRKFGFIKTDMMTNINTVTDRI